MTLPPCQVQPLYLKHLFLKLFSNSTSSLSSDISIYPLHQLLRIHLKDQMNLSSLFCFISRNHGFTGIFLLLHLIVKLHPFNLSIFFQSNFFWLNIFCIMWYLSLPSFVDYHYFFVSSIGINTESSDSAAFPSNSLVSPFILMDRQHL